MGVAFEPWVGEQYGRDSRWGVSVLLLGYSHYQEFKDVEHQHYTQHVVWRHVSGINDRSRYWTKCARDFGCEDGRPAFWSSVAFYNFIQEFMADPRQDPTPGQIGSSWAGFDEVLSRLQPDVVIAMARRCGTGPFGHGFPSVARSRCRTGRRLRTRRSGRRLRVPA